MAEHTGTIRKRLTVTGQVQGVGFRPFVYRLATELGLVGYVNNDARGVTIEVQGPARAAESFARRLRDELPPLAQIQRLDESHLPTATGEKRFEIRPSEGGELADAQVTVDTATCADCLAELADPDDPRYAYPFINCTHCGPRYTIVTRTPYDRPNTTMVDFAMCPLCAGQYADPGDRRFHAQPVACPACGPAVWLVDTHGRQIACDDPIAEAASMLRAGKVVAIKGLGGFHLACRADDPHAVGRLRRRKRRDAKPFALMAADLQQARRLCRIDPQAEALLTGPIRPILLLDRKPDAPVAPAVADRLDVLAIMLPYTPLHPLLFARAPGVLVMTSGNYSDEPLVKDNDAAVAHLGRIADAVLLHNRRIERRVDDSVVQLGHDGHVSVLRRARGHAPQPVHLSAAGADTPAILAVGAELKNTVCLLQNGRAVLSEHIGDLKDGRVYRHFIDTISHLEGLFAFTPELLAADAHPGYLSSEYTARHHAGELPGRAALPVQRVQHHHAHIVSCMAENDWVDPVIGLACDGVGYGDDGAVWGCEVLRAELHEYRRLGHLRYIPLVGGDAAAVETYRPALAALHDTFGNHVATALPACRLAADDQHVQVALEMLSLGVQCPPTSSLGRWFDAVAGLTGVAPANRFEGEAPMTLEAVADRSVRESYPFELQAAGPFLIDLRPMVEQLVADLAAGVAVEVISAKFHNTVVAFLAASAQRAREETGLSVVALSGGCFANRTVTARLAAALAGEGFRVLRHQRVPCNDGGIALGQAVVAAACSREADLKRLGPATDLATPGTNR